MTNILLEKNAAHTLSIELFADAQKSYAAHFFVPNLYFFLLSKSHVCFQPYFKYYHNSLL